MQLFIENIGNLFTLNYWFDLTPGPLFQGVLSFLYIFFAVMIILGFASKAMVKKNQKNTPLRNIWSKFYFFLSTMGFLGLIVTFFRAKQVNFFGAPFWMLFWLIGLIVWLVFIIRYIKVKIPKIKEEIELKQEMDKYMPKR
jgi:NhaP-type Na+/H+ or K+/H+ antiporter